MSRRDQIPRGTETCVHCGRRLKWSEETRGSFGMLRRWYHARVPDSFVAASSMGVEIVSTQFHEMYAGNLK